MSPNKGKKPVKDWNGNDLHYEGMGEDLMGGFFMCLWALICDLDHCFKAYDMPRSTNNCPCGLCPCNSGNVPWFDFRPQAAWVNLVYTVQAWLAAGLKRSFVFDIVGVTILSFYPDWMHCKSLGIDKYLIGSVLYLLVHYVMPHDDPEDNLSLLWQQIEMLYASFDTQNRYGKIRQTMFTTKSAPKMQGTAAEIKDFGPILVELWRHHMNPNLTMHCKILTVLEGSAHCDKILAEHPDDFALPEEAADDLIATAFIYLGAWYDLSMHFKRLRLPLFGLTGKAHLLMHSCLLSRFLLELVYKNDLGHCMSSGSVWVVFFPLG